MPGLAGAERLIETGDVLDCLSFRNRRPPKKKSPIFIFLQRRGKMVPFVFYELIRGLAGKAIYGNEPLRGGSTMLFDSFSIKGVAFKNRILRSSMGGRTSYYDGTVSPAWRHFEKKFSQTGVAGIISATIDIDRNRLSPLEYPKLSEDRFIGPLREGIKAVHQHDCRYIIQIGDPGGQTQTSLLSQDADAKSASAGFDLLYGYRNHTIAMTTGEVEREVEEFEQAARRVRETGADGIEITASKGYIIHQFLNPATNRRSDRYGGSADQRFQLLREIVTRVRAIVGEDFLFGIRLSAEDYNYLPVNLRLPVVFPLRHYFFGNRL
ncbi:MAG: hypothetical protein JO356_20265, partial [Acidobacteria bacterium]|nr:hypothetical protein [Acidobacteriota bacterium]